MKKLLCSLATILGFAVVPFALSADGLDVGWTAKPMSLDSKTIRTEGTLCYAYARGGAGQATDSHTVNGVTFVGLSDANTTNFSWKDGSGSGSGIYRDDGDSKPPEGVFGDYGVLLQYGWWWKNGDCLLKLKNLTVGNKYLFQMVMCTSQRDSSAFPPGDDTIEAKSRGEGWELGGSLVQVFVATSTVEERYIKFTGGNARFNALQVRDVTGWVPPEPEVIEPSIGTAEAAVDGSTVTFTLTGIEKGTDDLCDPATSYSVAYSLDSAAAVTVLSNQTAASAVFKLRGLADGDHSCSITITSDKEKTSEAKVVAFKTDSAYDFTWTASPMSADASEFSNDGDLVYAYCGTADSSMGGSTVTVQNVEFVTHNRSGSCIKPAKFSVSPDVLKYDQHGMGSEGITDENVAHILKNGWWCDVSGQYVYTLKDLMTNETYQVQMFFHWAGTAYTFTASDDTTFVKTSGDGWTYGGILTGTFKAGSDTAQFKLNHGSNGKAFMNAIQVRKISGVKPKVVEPSIGSATATTGLPSTTISLSGIVMGTGDDCEKATSYSVCYQIAGHSPVTKLTEQTGKSVSFDITGLPDGNYSCDVWIENNKGKTSSAKNVVFTIDSSIPTAKDFDQLKDWLESAESGATIAMTGITYTATSTITITAANVKLITLGDKASTVIDGDELFKILSVQATGFSVEGVTFRNGNAGGSGRGGAVDFSSASYARTAKIVNCDFIDCVAQYGGAISAGSGSYSTFEARENYGLVSGCTFLRCGIVTSDFWGGGGAITGAMWIENCVFDACSTGNCSQRHDHAAINVTSCMTISNCVFRNHRTMMRGLVGTDENKQAAGFARLVDCLIADNVTTNINCNLFHRKVQLDRCVISNNQTTVAVDTGLPGFIRQDSAGDKDFSRITSSLFIDNKYPFNMNESAMPVLENCTFVRNVGGLTYEYSGPDQRSIGAITNCVFWDNVAYTNWPYGGNHYGTPGFYYHAGVDNITNVLKLANDVMQVVPGTTNLMSVLAVADPSGASANLTALAEQKGVFFKDAAAGDFRPMNKSLLVGAGLVSDWMSTASDLAGHSRKTAEKVSIGAYEPFGSDPRIGTFIMFR